MWRESSECHRQWEAARCLTGNLQAVGIWLHQVSHLYWSQGLRRNKNLQSLSYLYIEFICVRCVIRCSCASMDNTNGNILCKFQETWIKWWNHDRSLKNVQGGLGKQVIEPVCLSTGCQLRKHSQDKDSGPFTPRQLKCWEPNVTIQQLKKCITPLQEC